MRALEKAPEARFPSAVAFSEELLRIARRAASGGKSWLKTAPLDVRSLRAPANPADGTESTIAVPTIANGGAKRVPLGARGTTPMREAPLRSPIAHSVAERAPAPAAWMGASSAPPPAANPYTGAAQQPSLPDPTTRPFASTNPPSQAEPTTRPYRPATPQPTLSDVTAPPVGMTSRALASSFSGTGPGALVSPLAASHYPPAAPSNAPVRPSASITVEPPPRRASNQLGFAIAVIVSAVVFAGIAVVIVLWLMK
jgi:hypothetical protein